MRSAWGNFPEVKNGVEECIPVVHGTCYGYGERCSRKDHLSLFGLLTPRRRFRKLGRLLAGTAIVAGLVGDPHFCFSRSHIPNSKKHPSSATQTEPDKAAVERAREAYCNLPLSFEVNIGQADPTVNFISHGSGYTLFLKETEVELHLAPTALSDVRSHSRQVLPGFPGFLAKGVDSAARVQDLELGHSTPVTVRMRLVGAHPSCRSDGIEQLPGKVNYFIGNDSRRWHTDIPTYSKVKYHGVYPGIDLIYYGRQHQLEYDFVVSPGADPSGIGVSFEGATELEVDAAGNLAMQTGGGQLRVLKPRIYQDLEGSRMEISGRLVIREGNQVGFQVEDYDRSKYLLIDPVLSYAGNFAAATGPLFSTYLGGSGADFANAISVDAAGNAYVTGSTKSLNYPAASSVQTLNKGGLDVFVTKLNPAGSAVIYSTYLGGADDDAGFGIAVDSTGSAYVVGQTSSSDFPKAAPFQSTPGSGGGVYRSTNAGSNWSSISFGLTDNIIYSLAIDPNNPSTLFAGTLSKGIFKSTGSGGTWNAVNTGVTRASIYSIIVDPSNSSKVYAGTFGGVVYRSTTGGENWSVGSLGPNVQAVSLAIDTSSTPYLYAGTFGAGVFRTSDDGFSWVPASAGLSSGFVFALAIQVSEPVRNPPPSTLYAATAAGVFKSNNRGDTWTAANAGLPDNVIASSLAITPSNTSVVYAGTLGNGVFKSTNAGNNWSAVNTGLAAVFVFSLVVDPKDPFTVYAGTENGVFKSTDGGSSWSAMNTGLDTIDVAALVIDPTNPSKLYVSTIASKTDAFVAKLSPGGSALTYSTYLGGSRRDYANGVAVDATGNCYVTGYTESSDFPTTNGVQTGSGGGVDAFVAKFNPAGSALAFSTYLGGSGTDIGLGIAADSAGNAYVAGSTDSTNFPTMAAFQSANRGGADAFVAKIRSSGSVLLYSTYLGGIKNDLGTAVAVDSAGSAYVTGYTESSGFPTANAMQSSNLGDFDAFVTKLDPAGSRLLYSTYLGGGSGDFGLGIAVDSSGNAYVTGYTDSTNFPLKNPLQPIKGGGVFKSRDGGNGWNASSAGLTDASIYSLVVDPAVTSNIYAGTFGGVFKSTDAGATWRTANNGLTNTNIYSLVIDPTATFTLYAGTKGGGVYKSTDAGNSWASVNSGLTNLTILAIAIDPTNAATIYAGTAGGGVFKSSNGGNSWNAVNTGLTNLTVGSLAAARTTATTLYAGTTAGVFRSMDAGSTWAATNLTQTQVNIVAVDPAVPPNVYVATEQGIFKASGGSGFNAINSGLPNPSSSSLAIDATIPSTIYAGTFNGIFKSTNGGAIWSTTALTSDYSFPSSLAVDPKSPSSVYAGFLGSSEIFVSKLNASGSVLVYSTYFGGIGRDRGVGIALDSSGNAYVTGDTTSPNFPTAGALQALHGGGSTDAFVLKVPAVLGPLCTVDCTAAVSASEKAGNSVAFNATATPSNCSGSPTFEWNFGDGTAIAAQSSTTHIYAKPGTYTWTLTVRAADAIPCTKTGTIQIFGDPSRRRP
ncbi:MAG TPA: SBBP repeat-containing protein [Acidobacteriota bacterium]